MSVWELYTQLFTRSWRCRRFAWSCPKGAQRRSERKTLSWQQGDGRADQFISCSSWWSGDLRWKLFLLLWPRDQETEFPVGACWLSQTQEGQAEQILTQTFNDPFFDSTDMIYMHRVPTGQTVNKEYYVEVLRISGRDSIRKVQHSSNRVSGISTRTMRQSTTPSSSQTIWPRWASRQFVTLPIVQTLLPVTFGYSLSPRIKLEVVVMRQLRRWKRLWRRSLTRSLKRSSM